MVGTGASAVQFVPEVAAAGRPPERVPADRQLVAARARTASTRRWCDAAIRHIPGLQRLRRSFLFNYCESLTLAIRHPRTVGRLAGMRSAAFMRRQLPDPELRRRAWPDYTFGCKRVLFSSHYLPALGRPNVELVTDPIAEVTETGLRTQDGRQREVDCIIWGTGFRATEFVAPMRVAGADGARRSTRSGATAPTPIWA